MKGIVKCQNHVYWYTTYFFHFMCPFWLFTYKYIFLSNVFTKHMTEMLDYHVSTMWINLLKWPKRYNRDCFKLVLMEKDTCPCVRMLVRWNFWTALKIIKNISDLFVIKWTFFYTEWFIHYNESYIYLYLNKIDRIYIHDIHVCSLLDNYVNYKLFIWS